MEDKQKIERLIKKYPDRIPVVIKKSKYCNKDIPDLDKTKYLVPYDITIGQFQYVIRQRLKLTPSEGLFIFYGNKSNLISNETMIFTVYEQYKNKKNEVLYAEYTKENVFG